MLDDKSLSSVNKLRYVKLVAPSLFRKFGQKSLLNACEDYAGHLFRNKLSEPSLSRALNTKALDVQTDRKPAELDLERALGETPALRRHIEEGLGLPGLFACDTKHDVDDLLAAAQPTAGKRINGFGYHIPSVRLLPVPGNLPELARMRAPVPLYGSTEETTARELTRGLISPTTSFVHWNAEPWSGASLIVRALADRPSLKPHYDAFAMVRASRVDNPYGIELAKLAEELGLSGAQADLPVLIADALKARRILLVICDACNLPDGGFAKSHPLRLCMKALLEDRGPTEPTRLLTIGRASAIAELTTPRHEFRAVMDFSDTLNEAFKVPAGKRFDAFRVHWDRYRIHRGLKGVEYGGTRLKRCKWHYESSPIRSKEHVWPANLRLRAYFASNSENHAPFDPTAGFEALCGDKELPEDIKILHDEVASYLRRIAHRQRKSELVGLRHCSTALHWLSLSAADYLSSSRARALGHDISLHKVLPETLHNVAQDPETPVRLCELSHEDEDSGYAQSAYVVGLGIRALVQDHWRVEDPTERAVAHYLVAERLKGMEHDRERLKDEFPYAAHRGRNRLYYLAETIRHLMRACGSANGGLDSHEEGGLTEKWRSFPAAPKKEFYGCDPAEVVNYAFAELYQRQINRNTGFPRKGRKQILARALAKQHGAFPLAAELLQLMSEGEQIGVPHRALHPAFRPVFIRECGYAMLDLGELEHAETCFQRALDLDGLNTEHRIQALLDIALVQAELDKIEEARKSLDQAICIAGPEARDSIRRRIDMRKAHLAYLNADFSEAKEIIKRLDDLSHELEHVRIAIAGQEGQRLDALAANITHRFSQLEYASHEALGYRIALAHTQRKQGLPDSAEDTLNSVLTELLAYGSSERTLLRWLLESARTLAAQGRLIRGYAAYARPCAIRAKDKGFHRIARTSANLAKSMLLRMKQELETQRIPSDVWMRYIDSARRKEQQHVNSVHRNTDTNRRRNHMPNYADPLFGYFLTEETEVINSLASNHGIAAEIEKMANLLDELPTGSRVNSVASVAFDPERVAT